VTLISATRRTIKDPTKYFASILVWSNTEISAAVVALCMPSLKSLFSRLLSDSPLPSPLPSPNSQKGSANAEQPGHRLSVLYQKQRIRIACGPATDINDSEENLWVDHLSPSADYHGKTDSSATALEGYQVRISSGPTTGLNDSEENFWVDSASASADSHGKTNSSANALV
jgi:hypothetical protein